MNQKEEVREFIKSYKHNQPSLIGEKIANSIKKKSENQKEKIEIKEKDEFIELFNQELEGKLTN